MSRLVLLGFDDGDVDVLSRIAELHPRPEVLVSHPNPEALILKLAEISELETGTSAPEPREDDVLVVPDVHPGVPAEWIEAFRRLGVPIVSPRALENGMSENPSPRDGNNAGTPESREPEPEADAEPSPEPPARVDADTEEPRKRESEPAASGREQVPMGIWARPEDSFLYLARRAMGEDAAVTLWWEAMENLWVPLTWAGDSPWESTSRVELPSPWGRFGVTEMGRHRKDQALLEAFTRMAEDMALRDVAGWERREKELLSLGAPGEAAANKEWALKILETVEPKTAWLWQRSGDSWRSVHTWGDGVSLQGELTVNDELLGKLFREGGWEHWSPIPEMRVLMTFARDDHRWKLRLERVKQSVEKDRS